MQGIIIGRVHSAVVVASQASPCQLGGVGMAGQLHISANCLFRALCTSRCQRLFALILTGPRLPRRVSVLRRDAMQDTNNSSSQLAKLSTTS